jgi:phage tail sheath protein FI
MPLLSEFMDYSHDALLAGHGIVGSATEKTGLHALKQAGQKLGVIPRLIAAPGFTAHQHAADEANPVAAELPAVLDDLLRYGRARRAGDQSSGIHRLARDAALGSADPDRLDR